MNNIYKIPLWFIQIFGQSKSFKSNPIIGSRRLNRFALRAIRYLLAHFFAWCRCQQLKHKVSLEEHRTYQEQGFLLLENFVEEQDFKQIQAEVNNNSLGARQCIQGDTLTPRIMLDRGIEKCYLHAICYSRISVS